MGVFLHLFSLLELILSIFVCCLAIFLLVLITLSPLHYGFKSLVFLNTFALLTANSAQTLVEVWSVNNGEYPTKDNDYINSLYIVHSFGFYTCTLSFMFMIFERFLLCFNPFFYEDKEWDFPRFLFVISVVSFPFIVCIVLILQDDIMKMVSSFTMAVVEGTSAWMLILCHRKSQEYYTTRFMVVPLNVRYQASKVIELTHALIPICYLGFLVKIGAFFVFLISHNADSTVFVYSQIVFRMICTSYSLMEPIILISRVKILHRRFRMVMKTSKVNSVDYIPSDYNPQSYFNALRDQWG